MFKHKSKFFINDAQVSKVRRKEIVGKRKRENSIEEGRPNEWLRSFNALMLTTPPDFNKFLKSSL